MLFDSMMTKEDASVDIFETERELSVMVFEEGSHEVSLHGLDGRCHFKRSGCGKGCYRFNKVDYCGTFLIRAVTESYVLMKRIYLGSEVKRVS